MRNFSKKLRIYMVLVLFIPLVVYGLKSIQHKSPEQDVKSNLVPLPNGEDLVRNFINLIDEGRISEAIGMMDISDDSIKQTWGVSLNNFSSFQIKDIKEYRADGDYVIYEVDIDVVLKKDLQDLPLPNYGWFDGVNKRWITLMKVGNYYKITEIATGP